MMRNFIAIIKLMAFALALFAYFIASLIVTIFSGFSFSKARPHLAKIIALTSRVGLMIIGVKIKHNFKGVEHEEGHLIVSNHLSYLDVLVISSVFPSCFVTSREMKKTFFLGQICLLGGCLFVDRENRKNIHREIQELSEALAEGLNVAIFPEARSTNGADVLRFKRPLFQAALKAHAKILPMCLNYMTIDSEPITYENRDNIFWYGEMPFFSHALKLFSSQDVVVSLNVLPFINADDFNDKVELAEMCHKVISQNYSKIF
jgi:1-acyl-sn-glycerol-3-phosphate acyltransferase